MACGACGPGLYQNASGQTGCLGCLPGQYQNATGVSACSACPPNTISPGSTASILACSANAGYYARYTRTITAVVTLPAAQYNPSTFLAQLQAAAGPGATVTVG